MSTAVLDLRHELPMFKHDESNATEERVLNEIRARRILEKKLDFVYHPLFDHPHAEDMILAPVAEAGGTSCVLSRASQGPLPYLASLYEVPLLTKEQESHLFRKTNYLKFRAHQLRKKLDPKRALSSKLHEIERLQQEALVVRNQIIQANLRLVVSIAGRYLSSPHTFDELMSDGMLTLMGAVEHFDFARGNKFSTYATWAIRYNFARTIPQEHRWRHHNRAGSAKLLESVPDTCSDEHHYENEVQRMRCSIARILSKLDERDRSIIVARFGLNGHGGPQSSEKIAAEWGLSKQRIGQLLVSALNRLRQYAEEEHIELPDDEQRDRTPSRSETLAKRAAGLAPAVERPAGASPAARRNVSVSTA